MWNILDLLYECNIGYPDNNVLPITSTILQLEHQLLEWQASLAPLSGIITPQELRSSSDDAGDFSLARRFRVILTLRYHNVRILAHRRMLDLYLGSIERSQGYDAEDSMLRQVGHRSKGICMQSASELISIVHVLLHSPEPKRGLLGAWWFTLYYSELCLKLFLPSSRWWGVWSKENLTTFVDSLQRDPDDSGIDTLPASRRFRAIQLLRSHRHLIPSAARDALCCVGLLAHDRQGEQDGGQVRQVRGHTEPLSIVTRYVDSVHGEHFCLFSHMSLSDLCVCAY